MSTENLVVEQTQTVPSEPAVAQTQQPEVDTSKIFSKGYNEGKTKVEKDVLTKFRSLGIENAESLDDVVNHISQVLSPKKEQQNEVEQLRKMLEDANKKATEAQQSYEAFVQETKLEATMDTALSSLSAEGNLTLKADHLKNLFYMEYEIEENGGQFFATRNGIPVLDQEGNRKSIGSVMRDFVRENKYLTSRATGTGGSTGDATVSSKPSKAEFRSLLQSKNAGSQERAAEMYNTAKKTGWAD